MDDKKIQFGFYLTDASFDYSSKTTSIGIINIITKETFNFIDKAVNPTDAETKGIMKALDIAAQENNLNVIIICDNKSSINHARKRFSTEEGIRSKFWYAQFLWVPREYTHIADFLSKNISQELSESFKDLKEENINENRNKRDIKTAKKLVNEIKASKSNTNKTLEERLNQLHLLIKDKEYPFKSKMFSLIKMNDSFDVNFLSEFIIDEIDLIEKDVSFMEKEDPVIGLLSKLITDLLIFS